jgi:DNA repair ATPase RecN
VTRLDGEARVLELAQMLGGIDAAASGTAALASAAELLDRAEAWRARAAAAV